MKRNTVLRLLCISLVSMGVVGTGWCNPLPLPASTSAPSRSEEEALQVALQAVQARDEYYIGPSDLLDIMIYQETEMDRELRVSQSGTIDYPLVGSLKVGGLTVADAVKLLQTRLSEYLVKPQVTILIKEYKDRKIFVLGEVKKAGAYGLPTDTPMTVIEAVTLAGGFTDIAATQKTRVIRTVNGKRQTLYDNMSQISKKGPKGSDITLQPNDIVFVPQSFF